MNRLILKSFMSLVVAMMIPTTPAHAGAYDWMKGCIIMGATSAGGSSLAVGVSNTKMTNTESMIFSGVAGCLIGGFLVGDVVRKAEMRTEGELKAKRESLKMGVFSVQHDLRVLKGESGADGEPYERKQQNSSEAGSFRPLNSGN